MSMVEEGTKTGKFSVGKNIVDVEFSSSKGSLKWEKETSKKGKKDSIELPLADIVGADFSSDSWSVSYVRRTKDKWFAEEVRFKGDVAICQEWAEYIGEAVKAAGGDRPTSLLVFINPVGGKKHGVQDYEKISAPIFAKAKINTEVIVTEDGDHACRVLAEYNLDKIDGIVSVGGDGTFTRVVSGLLQRTLKDSGKDLDNKEESLITPNVRVGIIPTGTGQGMIRQHTKMATADITTATLHIVLGGTTHNHILSVHNADKFLYFSTMHVGYGVYSDTMETSESHRNLGTFRYVYALGKQCLVNRRFDAEIQYLPIPEGGDAEWQQVSGQFTMVNVMIYRMPKKAAGELAWMPDQASLHTLDASAGKSAILKHFVRFATQDPAGYEMNGYNKYRVRAIKYHIPSDTETDRKHMSLNIDGESVPVSDGEVYIRFHDSLVKVFGKELPPTAESAAAQS